MKTTLFKFAALAVAFCIATAFAVTPFTPLRPVASAAHHGGGGSSTSGGHIPPLVDDGKNFAQSVDEYIFPSWDDVSADARAVVEAYVSLVNDALGGNSISLSDIPLSWIKFCSTAEKWILSPLPIYNDVGNAVIHYLTPLGLASDDVINGDLRLEPILNSPFVPASLYKSVVYSYDWNYTRPSPLKSPENPDTYIFRDVSWRNDIGFSGSSFDSKRSSVLTIFFNGYLFGIPVIGEYAYIVPWYYDGEDYYYSPYRIRLRYSEFSNGTGITYSYINLMDETDVSSGNYWLKQFDRNYQNAFFFFGSTSASQKYFNFYTGKSDFLNRSTVASSGFYFSQSSVGGYGGFPTDWDKFFNTFYKSSDITVTLNNPWFYNKTKFQSSSNGSKPTIEVPEDFGFTVSNQPFTLDGFSEDFKSAIDAVPDNYYITINGDNYYEYIITNPDTGGSNTVNEYINNNYTIINNYGGEGSGQGNTSNWNISFDGFLSGVGEAISSIFGGLINTVSSIFEAIGNIANSIAEAIGNVIKGFFVVSDDDFSNAIDNLKLKFSSKLPYFADLGDMISSLFVELDDGNFHYAADIGSSGSGSNTLAVDDSPEGDVITDDDGYIYPKWEFTVTFFGKTMTLVIMDFAMYADSLGIVRLIVTVFVYVVYAVNLYKYLPTLIGNVGDMVNTTVTIASPATPKRKGRV